ncbi:FKBP-type peptidyl-prolyl cis-trans isomerase [Populibacterium corticicola]|uniref:Peptidyl-prolyl cis-trans isomerase n=1 Tax=Populibacterium corticicola TaxID=1812826 RepID=A0ABW5XC94_9MICO
MSHNFMHHSPTKARVFVVALVSALVLAGCAGDPVDEVTSLEATHVTVTGTADEAPTVEYDTPFVYIEPHSEAVWEGSGDMVEDGDWVLLRFYAEDPVKGDVLRNDFEAVPVPYRVEAASLGPELYSLIVNKPTGSRLLQVTQEDNQTSVIVIDVLPAQSTGEPREQSEEYPSVSYGRSGEPEVAIGEDVIKPTQLVVQQLRSGSSEQVDANSQVVLQYTAAKWKDAEVFDSTWVEDVGPVTVKLGAEQIITGLEQALIGAPIGSQLLVIVPPELGFADSEHKLAKTTLVYVVDIVAASSPKA